MKTGAKEADIESQGLTSGVLWAMDLEARAKGGKEEADLKCAKVYNMYGWETTGGMTVNGSGNP